MVDPTGLSRKLAQSDAETGVDLVIFDFDGVVANSEVISLSSLQTTLREFGVPLDIDQVRGRYLGAAIDKIERDVAVQSPRGTSEGFSQTWHDILFERFRRELTPVPGLGDLLDRIEGRGLPFCIASSSTFERLGIALEAMGLASRFTHVFSAQQVENGKPAPDLFLHAAAQFGVSPDRCLVVEDSPLGIRAAKAAGMHAIGFLGGMHLNDIRDDHRRVLMEAAADRIVESLGEIMSEENSTANS